MNAPTTIAPPTTDFGRTLIMAVIRTEHGRERTRFHLSDEKRIHILKARRYKDDAVLYVFVDRPSLNWTRASGPSEAGS